MTDTTASLLPSVPTYQPLSDEDHGTCYDSLGWSVWSLGRATEILTFAVDALARELAADPDYATEVVEVYKMMAVERVLSARRERIADDMLGRLREALMRANHLPAGDPLAQPIDYAKVPPSLGFHPDDINGLRLVLG